jgi:hypothetical protein
MVRPGPRPVWVGLAAAMAALAGCEGRGGRYVSAERRFALQPPAGWAVREYSGDPCLFILAPGAGLRPGEAGGPGQANLNVVALPAAPHVTLEEAVADGRRQAERLAGYEALADEPRTLRAGGPARAITFCHQALGPRVTVRQLYVVARGRAYTVTAAAPSDEFAAYEPDFEACLNSFQAGW